ncbi:hypothetical protein EPJ66_00500 [Brachyspira aalborgi]|uniref:hypothetical protein n=1 Tax=Brachyspira aalborgi TaxID=29522 RepID=UPI0011C86EAA|nr:hypothetical protein [Brachyspira aalborgi]TXJ55122.1 hypothetical protein EPJ66_00500 [Brachyspira aalborgi]
MNEVTVYIIIILFILSLFSILWHNFWTPFLLNSIKIKILNEKNNIISYCNDNNINKKSKKLLIKAIDTIYSNIGKVSILEFIFFNLFDRLDSNSYLSLFKDIEEKDYVLLKAKVDNIFMHVVVYMIFSSIIATILFLLYLLYVVIFNIIKFSLNNTLRNILNVISVMKLWSLIENLDFNDSKIINS